MSIWNLIWQIAVAVLFIIGYLMVVKGLFEMRDMAEALGQADKGVYSTFAARAQRSLKQTLSLEWNVKSPYKFLLNVAFIAACLYFKLYIMLVAMALGTLAVAYALHREKVYYQLRSI